MPEVKGFDEALRNGLEQYRTAGRAKPLTMTAMATELGVSSTRVCKYLAGKPEGDVTDMEARVADLLKAAKRRSVIDVTPFETNVTQIIHATLELVRKTNDVGLIAGPAGIGKSIAARSYHETKPTSIWVTMPRWQRSDAGLVGLLFDACETRSWSHNTPRANWLCDHLSGSNRLIIIDNAQRMTAGAREWIFDLHDATACPVALVANPELLAAIRGNDQQFSRVGIYQQVALAPKQIRDYAKRLVDALVPNADGGLHDFAAAVAEERGHLRALKKQLLLMLDLVQAKHYGGDQVKAFQDAHTKLVRDYQL